MAGRRGQRCGTRPHGHWPRSSGNRPSAPASGRPPAPKRRPVPGLLDGAGRGPAPRQPFHRYWSAGPTPSPCGPIRARHERRPIGRPRVSVPPGTLGTGGVEIRARPSRRPLACTALGGHLYSGQRGRPPRRQPGFSGHVRFGQGRRLYSRFPPPDFRLRQPRRTRFEGPRRGLARSACAAGALGTGCGDPGPALSRCSLGLTVRGHAGRPLGSSPGGSLLT